MPRGSQPFLEALGPALRAVSLPQVIPKFPTQAGRKLLPKYAAAAFIARRGGSSPTVFEEVVLRLQRAANVARLRLARGSGAALSEYSEGARG